MKTTTTPQPHVAFSFSGGAKLLIAFLLFSYHSSLISQNIAINATGAAANPSALLDLSSHAMGFLPPRMTDYQMRHIGNPDTSLIVFNTTTNCLMFYVGSTWQNISCACVSPPSTPGGITGSATVCANATGAIYSIAPVLGAEYYTWSAPAGATIIAGQGTTSITVNFGSASGNISVSDSNGCGHSAANSLAVTVSATPSEPAAPNGPASLCPNATGNIYSIAAVTGATTYTWTVPSSIGTIASGQGTTSITITAAASSGSGSISVTASNTCGTSSAGSGLSVSVASPPITLDHSSSANGATSFSISTTNPNELIIVAADGCCTTSVPSVTVDGNAASLIYTNDATAPSGTDIVIVGYLAPSAGSHSISVTETGYSSPYYANMAASFAGGCSLSPAKTIASANSSGGSSSTSTSVTTTSANNYLFASNNWQDGSNPQLGFTGSISSVLQAIQEGNGIACGIGAASASNAGTYTVTSTGAGGTNAMVLIAIQP